MSVVTEIRIDSWDQFDSKVHRSMYRTRIYRGHAESRWSLQSSLFRAFESGKRPSAPRAPSQGQQAVRWRTLHEQNAFERFKSGAHLYLKNTPDTDRTLEWLAIMQHYGAPTRLLDFTFSPYIAAYFALESGTEDCAVYSIDANILSKDAQEYCEHGEQPERVIDYSKIFEVEDPTLLYAYEPAFMTERLIAQQGVFLVPGSNDISHEQILQNYDLDENDAVKYIIPKQLRRDGLTRLLTLNITATVLFPGLEGFCRSFGSQNMYPCIFQIPIR